MRLDLYKVFLSRSSSVQSHGSVNERAKRRLLRKLGFSVVVYEAGGGGDKKRKGNSG